MSIDDTPYGWTDSRETEPETYDQPRWEIEVARYFGYSETTLALIKSPDNEHYIVRCAGYPYGRPKMDSTRDKNRYLARGNYEAKKEHWNDFINDVAYYNRTLTTMANKLNALPFIPCLSSAPLEEFEELSEIERFMTRDELYEKHKERHDEQVEEIKRQETAKTVLLKTTQEPTGLRRTLSKLFSRKASPEPPPAPVEIKIPAFSPGRFLTLDVNRKRLYASESNLYRNGYRDEDLTQDEVKGLVEKICKDFAVPCPKHISLVNKMSFMGPEGSYYPATTKMRLAHFNGKASKHTLLHELAHHLDNVMTNKVGERGINHGMRFKKILLNLLHEYAELPSDHLKSHFQSAYGAAFPLRDQDIIGRDFDETRTADITHDTGYYSSGLTILC